MTVKELIEILEDYRDDNPDAQVLLMTQENWPFENELLGVSTREEIYKRTDDDEPNENESNDDIFLVEGQQLGYGSRNAWNVYRRY